jgi:hypothetical protein
MVRPHNDPKFARESFTWRRMKTWQILVLLALAILLAVFGLYSL